MLYAIMANCPASYDGASTTVALEAYPAELGAYYALQSIRNRVAKMGKSELSKHISGTHVQAEQGFWVSPWVGDKFFPKNVGDKCTLIIMQGQLYEQCIFLGGDDEGKCLVQVDGHEKIVSVYDVFQTPEDKEWGSAPEEVDSAPSEDDNTSIFIVCDVDGVDGVYSDKEGAELHDNTSLHLDFIQEFKVEGEVENNIVFLICDVDGCHGAYATLNGATCNVPAYLHSPSICEWEIDGVEVETYEI
jgi:hypothetical protein